MKELVFKNPSVYSIIVLLVVFLCLFSTNVSAQQCQAKTKSGSPCKRKAQSGFMYCWQHKPMNEHKAEEQKTAPSSSIKKSTEKVVQPAASNANAEYRQCKATTKKGKQCSRRSQKGSRFCRQHSP